MKLIIFSFCLAGLFLASCQENSYDRHSTTDEISASDSSTGYQTGEGTEVIAAPNAANTKRTPVPLDTVEVDTSSSAATRR